MSKTDDLRRLVAVVTGEMRVEDVPLAPWAQKAVEQLKAGDDDPLEVVVEVPAGKSKRGWNYTPQALQRIVEAVNRDGLPGILGHQRPEDVDHQFPMPVTHWVGAKWENGKAYFRGVIDKAASDLKRWVRAGVIRQVSIFGRPKLANVAGEVHVVDYQPLSIDWTPLNRAGMPTRVVAVGEMDSTFADTDYLDAGSVPAPAGEQNGGDQAVTLQEALAVVREHLASRNATIAGVCGEMGWDFDTVAKEIGGDQYRALEERAKLVGEMAQVFGLAEDAKAEDVLAAAKAAREAQLEVARAKREELIDKVVGEMVTAEAARPLIKRMLHLPDGDLTEEQVRKVVGEMLEQPDVKQVIGALFKAPVMAPKAADRDQGSGGLVTRRLRLG